MTDDIAVELTGDMAAGPSAPKTGFNSLWHMPTALPNPKDWLTQQRQNVRPWLVFLQTANFKAPASIPRLSRRIMHNIEYFQSNYIFVFLGLIVYCLITSPLLLIAIAGSFYCGYKLSSRHATGAKFALFGRELTLAQQYGLVAVGSMPVLYLVGAHGVIFWVIGASFTLIMLHAAFYNIDALMSHSEDGFGLLQEV